MPPKTRFGTNSSPSTPPKKGKKKKTQPPLPAANPEAGPSGPPPEDSDSPGESPSESAEKGHLPQDSPQLEVHSLFLVEEDSDFMMEETELPGSVEGKGGEVHRPEPCHDSV